MDDVASPAAEFEEHRDRLRRLAYRMLGSADDADDALQEAWIRVERADASTVDNPGGWLTTVVTRICLDMLRARATRPSPTAELGADRIDLGVLDPHDEAELSEAVSASLMVVLDTLRPSERIAFVLHDLFSVPFDDIGAVLRRSPAAAKQLASRARRRVAGGGVTGADSADSQRAVVVAFLEAARGGDLQRLVSLLHPDVSLDADGTAVRMGSPAQTLGVDGVAATFNGRAQGARAAAIDGVVGFYWAVGDRLRVVWEVDVDPVDGRIVHLEMLADEEVLDALELVPLPDGE